MNDPLSKSNARRPLKMALFLLLVALSAFSFVSGTAQLHLVSREIQRIGSYYPSIGQITTIDPGGDIITDAVQTIAQDPMLALQDNPRMCQGIVDDVFGPLYEQEEDFKDEDQKGLRLFLTDSIFIAKVEAVYKLKHAVDIHEGIALTVIIQNRLGGFPDLHHKDKVMDVVVEPVSSSTGEKIPYVNSEVIDKMVEEFAGRTFLFRAYSRPSWKNLLFIKPLYINGPLVYEVKDERSILWDDPQWRALQEDRDVLNENIHSFHIITTKDLSTRALTQENAKLAYLLDGRYLNREDQENKNPVCVINGSFAKSRGIKIGDTLPLRFRNTEKGIASEFLVTAKDRKEWKTYETSAPTPFTVVGIMETKFSQERTSREIYVPDSTLPPQYGHGSDEVYSGIYGYSFTLKSSKDQGPFMDKYQQKLKDLGYKLEFVDHHSAGFWQASEAIKRSALHSFVLFALLLLLLSQGFVVYLYREDQKLSYAIARALGVPKKVAAKQMKKSFLLLMGIGIVLGGYGGFCHALNKAGEQLSTLPNPLGIRSQIHLPLYSLVAMLMGTLLLLYLLLSLALRRLEKQSVIQLIQNQNQNQKQGKKEATKPATKPEAVSEGNVTQRNFPISDPRENGTGLHPMALGAPGLDHRVFGKSGKRSLAAHGFTHALRSKISTGLIVATAGTFVFSLLWMNGFILKNKVQIQEAYDHTVVEGDILVGEVVALSSDANGPIPATALQEMTKTGLIQDWMGVSNMAYHRLSIERHGKKEHYQIGSDFRSRALGELYSVYSCNKGINAKGSLQLSGLQIKRGRALEEFDQEWALDYADPLNPQIKDAHGKQDFPILAAEKTLKEYHLQVGDRIALSTTERKMYQTFGTIVGSFLKVEPTRHDDLAPVSMGEESIFIYPYSVSQLIEPLQPSHQEFHMSFYPEKNRELMAKKEDLKKRIGQVKGSAYALQLKLWDGDLLHVINPLERNLSLLEILYPLSFFIAMVMAGVLAFLLTLRRSKEGAVLRMLGVTSKEVRRVFFLESFALCFMGAAWGGMAMGIFSGIPSWAGGGSTVAPQTYGYITGAYLLGSSLGLLFGLNHILRKKPLELLQVKE